MKINVLEPQVYNRISAGEVVERPASIVKELVENSIDAGATKIRVEIEGGGIKNITVSDDGSGIDKDDLLVAFLPHATSKIKNAQDLDNILSLGFRGEALASISSVCQVKLSSKTADSEVGYSLKVEGGQFGKVTEVARKNGTTISCSNLFFNTPVRAKFLKKPKTEEAEITHLIEKFMLAYSNLSFEYYVDGKIIYNTSSCSMSDIIYTIYGNEIYENLVKIDYEEQGYKLTGYVTKPTVSKSNRTYQTLFVNNRYVENSLISTCVTNVFSSFLMKGRFPVYVLSLSVPTENVDVNVHPSKREVRFENPNLIYGIVSRALDRALLKVDQIQNFIMADGIKSDNENKVYQEKLPEKEDKFDNLLKSMTLENSNEKAVKNQTKEVDFGGKSFDADAQTQDVKLQEEYEVKSNNTQGEFESIENLTIKNLKNNNSIFFFDQSGEKFNREIEDNQNFLKASVENEMNILGTVFKTYIVIEYKDAIYFIDQHAGHERILYDKLVKMVDNHTNERQQLLAPFTFTVGPREAQSIEALLENLNEIGFEIVKDNYTFTITTVPYILSYIDLQKFVDEIVAEGAKLESKASDFIHERLCQSACKHAIKAGDEITKEECAYLIEEVRKGVMLCPHGRPITLVITKHEFEKMFKRIV